MEKHTPTPWKWERPSRIMLDAGIQRYAIYRGTELKPDWIAEIHFAKHDVINNGLDENQANAELIVKAVNNHEQLVQMLQNAKEAIEALHMRLYPKLNMDVPYPIYIRKQLILIEISQLLSQLESK